MSKLNELRIKNKPCANFAITKQNVSNAVAHILSDISDFDEEDIKNEMNLNKILNEIEFQEFIVKLDFEFNIDIANEIDSITTINDLCNYIYSKLKITWQQMS